MHVLSKRTKLHCVISEIRIEVEEDIKTMQNTNMNE
jgi:hypothetical protein